MNTIKLLPILLVFWGNAKLWSQAAPTASTGDPNIQFASTTYDWGTIMEGIPVKTVFVFTNTGTGSLRIFQVQPGCQCTTSGDWTHQAEPGQTGVIPIQFNTSHYGRTPAGNVTKQVTVTCNDPNHSLIYLQIHGTVWKPFEFTELLNMQYIDDSPTNSVFRTEIVNTTEEKVELSQPEVNNANFTAEIQTVRPGKEFEMTVKATRPPGADSALAGITIKTTSTNQPVISMRAFAVLKEGITFNNSITLPAGAITNQVVFPLAFMNNNYTPLTLTNASVNATGVDLQLKETVAGQQYILTATFPPGFVKPPGTNVEITVESSNPKYRTIHIPVVQPVPPAAAK